MSLARTVPISDPGLSPEKKIDSRISIQILSKEIKLFKKIWGIELRKFENIFFLIKEYIQYVKPCIK
jgi:hypothetical protein